MYLNLNTGVLGMTLPRVQDVLALAKRHGFAGADLPREAYMDDDAAEAARAAYAGTGLKPGLFWLPANFFGTGEQFAEGTKKLREILPRIARIGATRTYDHIWPASDERDFAANFAWHRERLKPLTDLLGEHGVRMGLEFIGGLDKRRGKKHTFLYTLEGILTLADAVAPHVGVILDTFHWWTSGGTVEDLQKHVDPARVINVHVNDGYAGRTRDEQQDLERAMPGETGLIDLPSFFSVLSAKGYTGPITCEPFNPTKARFSAVPPDAVAAEVAAAMQRVMA